MSSTKALDISAFLVNSAVTGNDVVESEEELDSKLFVDDSNSGGKVFTVNISEADVVEDGINSNSGAKDTVSITFGADSTVVDEDGLSFAVEELTGTGISSGINGTSLLNGSPIMGYPFTATKNRKRTMIMAKVLVNLRFTLDCDTCID